MNEIKFRCYNKTNKGVIIYFSLEDFCRSGNGIDDKHLDEDELVFMQYTGLKDKNGKEIYEGDILEAETKESCQWLLVYNESLCSYLLERYVNGKKDTDSYGIRRDLIVVGNVYETPNLLK